MRHKTRNTGHGRPEGSEFVWVNLGSATLREPSPAPFADAIPSPRRYLAAFEWRYNHRFELPKNLQRLARVATRIVPQPRKTIAEIRPNAADLSG